MRIKKWTFLKALNLKILIQLKFFFWFTKIYALTRLDSLKIVWRIRHLIKIILKGRGFRGGSDEKMRRMWLGREIVVAGLPPFNWQKLDCTRCWTKHSFFNINCLMNYRKNKLFLVFSKYVVPCLHTYKLLVILIFFILKNAWIRTIFEYLLFSNVEN